MAHGFLGLRTNAVVLGLIPYADRMEKEGVWMPTASPIKSR